MKEPRGAGSAGGLLFVAGVLFVGYLALRALAGAVRFALAVVLLLVVVALVMKVLDRS